MLKYSGMLFLLLAIPGLPGCGKHDHLPDFGKVADFKFQERSGKEISLNQLQGKVWLASFVFTRCTGPCPQVCATLARLQEQLKNQPHVQIVTFTVDPDRDNPKELDQYASNFQADPNRWWFLTGKEEELHKLIRESFKLAVGRNPAELAKPGMEFIHSPRIVLVDKKGVIRGYYEGTPTDMEGKKIDTYEPGIQNLLAASKALASE